MEFSALLPQCFAGTENDGTTRFVDGVDGVSKGKKSVVQIGPWTMDLGMHWRQSSFNFRKLIYLPANYQVINCKEIVFFGGEIIPWKTFFLTFLIPPRSNRKNYQLTVINPGIETSSLPPFVVTEEELLFAN